MLTIRHCPRCRTDYRPEVGACGECGGPLDDRVEDGDPRFAPPRVPAPPSQLPAGNYHSIYFSHEIRDLESLGGQLARRGIPFRIDTKPGRCRSRYDLAVRDEERAAAVDELNQLLRADVSPEHCGAVERHFDPDKGYFRCPACDARLGSGARECPDCGLALAGAPEELACARCGNALGPAGDCRHGCDAEQAS